MKRFVFAAVASLIPTICMSLPAVVTGGEHSDFTRLVVTLPKQSDWRLGRVADGYTLSVNQPDLEYDLRKAFTRIPKTRLADVAQVEFTSDLHIVAACPCYVTAFAFRPNVIVVDIRGGSPPENSDFEFPLVSFSAQNPEDVEKIFVPKNTDIALGWTERLGEPDKKDVPSGTLNGLLAPGFRENIAKQLSAAASQGLVTLDAPPASRSEKTPVAPSVGVPPSPDTQFRVVTEAGMDVRLGGLPDEADLIQDSCLPNEAVDISSWGEPSEDPAKALAGIRHMLITDAERLPTDRVTDAAKRYLYFGFGAEAALLLSSLPELSKFQMALVDIGKIVDGKNIDQSVFAGMENCNNAASLWSLLSRGGLRPSEPINAGAIVQAFSAMPYRLRELLAPRVIDRLLENGDQNAARMVRDTISRVVTETPSAMQVTEARLEVLEDRPEKAKEVLEAATTMSGPNEAAALVALVNMDFAARNPVSPARIQMIQTLAAQSRGQAIAKDLLHALVLAYSLSGEFQLAQDSLQDAPSAEKYFWELMAEIGTDADIINMAFSPPENLGGITENSAHLIASKLLTIGFPSQSLIWLGLPEKAVDSLPDSARLTAAEAYLVEARPKEALSAISGMEDVANSVRFRALRALKDEQIFSFAADYEEYNEDMIDVQINARQWGKVASQASGVWSDAAAMVANLDEAASPSGPISLSSAQQTASSSTEAREVIFKLLKETQFSQFGQ